LVDDGSIINGIWIPGIEAEAELLSAMVAFFTKVGLTAEDVGIKINSRGVTPRYS